MGNCVSSKKLKRSEDEGRCELCKGNRNSGSYTCNFSRGSCSCPPNAAPSPSCVFYSPRIQGLLEGHRTEIDTARDHWTAVDPTSEAEAAKIADDNRKYFDEVLVKHPKWGAFFRKFEDFQILGEKIGEGGQAEIFAAKSPSFVLDPIYHDVELVAKVWKAGVPLEDLERQWPSQMLSEDALEDPEHPFRTICGGAFIRDGEFQNRFAFVMQRRWGDLRTHIDQRMLKVLCNNSHGPPFKDILYVYILIWAASNDLRKMHAAGDLHRNIKASNLLLASPLAENYGRTFVIDFECSIGVTGTRFWRAPEVLEQLQMRIPSHELVFTKKADIYIFGMMCYEIIIGCIPFEGHPQNYYSIVLRGERPRLPDDLAPWLKELVHDCWQHDPQLRPTSYEIRKRLKRLVPSTFSSSFSLVFVSQSRGCGCRL